MRRNYHPRILLACGASLIVIAMVSLSLHRLHGSRSSAPPGAPFDVVSGRAQAPADVRIWLEPEAWEGLERQPRQFVAGQFEYAGRTYPARIRLKGHRSMRKLSDKPAFRLEFAESDGFLGQRSLVLNNLVEDPTLEREALAYHLMRGLGLPAPRTAYARVELNGAPYGVYLMLEPHEQAFESHRFGSTRGALYEGEYGCDILASDVTGFDLDAGDDPARAELTAFAGVASGDARALFDPRAGPLDMVNFLTYLAASAVVGDFDGYRHAHNYYVHYDGSANKWRFLPWGLDRAFKTRLAVTDSQGWLARRCFDDAACRLEYVRTLRTVVARFEAMDLAGVARDIAAQVDAAEPAVEAETISARATLMAFIRERPSDVRSQLGCIDAAGNELDRDGDGYGCTDCDDANPSTHPGAVEACDSVDNDCSGLEDDGPTCDCQTASIAGTEFHLCALPMPWAAAEQFCARKGLSLAHIESARQSKSLYRRARRIAAERWWIGYSDRDQEGDFRWSDGAASSFTYWSRSQPDNGRCNEDCVALKEGGRGRWHDTHCGQHRPFICGPAPSVAAHSISRADPP